ncbi:MAG: protein-L-isoaspartate(D-aspartate) O-methyltransferase [Alphaproteobacteria bacterium]
MTGHAADSDGVSQPDPARVARLIMTLRQHGISDMAVLKAMEQTPRDLFVPEHSRERAWEDTSLPIGEDQRISQPSVVAMMTQALGVGPRDKVLEIGTGSGYQAAVLAHVVRRVYTIERHRSLMRQAQILFNQLGLSNIVTRVGDGSTGWPEQAPFDGIIVTAAADVVPTALIEQLRDGGVLVVPVGRQHSDQSLVRITRTGETWREEPLTPVRFVPLVSDRTVD